MRRNTTALLARSAVALTGCGPTIDDVHSMVAAGSAKTYYDALALREDIIAAGIKCLGTNQQVIPDESGTAYLKCANRIMAMAVTGSKKELEKLLDARDNTGTSATVVLHAAEHSPLSKHRVKD